MLPFLDRVEELARLKRLLDGQRGALAVLYGRRRLGKSRLIREAVSRRRHVFYVGDERESVLQRASLAQEIGRLLPGFDRATYQDWSALFDRFWAESGGTTTLVLDEFSSLASAGRELPSVLQKRIDGGGPVHLVLCGSSQRMMQGLVLDRSAPLYGRATEILAVRPIEAGWIQKAIHLTDPRAAVEAYAVWGGVPRYWELAGDFPSTAAAVRHLVLSPLGVLYEEPARLLLDDMRETVQAASILSLIGRGCHRLSEIAVRLGKPATSLTRPLQRLVDLDLVRRDAPFEAPRSSRRSLYRIGDPFLRFWFRFVEPHRSLLESRRVDLVERDIAPKLDAHVGEVWEELARASVPRLQCHGREWGTARRWWGAGADRSPLEIDLAAESIDGKAVLIGDVQWGGHDMRRTVAELRGKAARFPLAHGREVLLAIWCGTPARRTSVPAYSPGQVLGVLR